MSGGPDINGSFGAGDMPDGYPGSGGNGGVSLAEALQFRTLTDIINDRLVLARMLGMTHDGKRDVYGVLGYDDVITWRQYRERYARGGIAGRVVDALAKATWRGEGNLFEDEDTETDTEFEKAWKALNEKHKVWSTLMRAHILASLGSFSGLLLGAPDDFSVELPHGKPGQLLYLTPFGGGVVDLARQQRGQSGGTEADIMVKTWVEDTKDPRFGQPLAYQLKRVRVAAPELAREVHWSRIVHIPAHGFLDDAVYGPPALECVWNYLLDMDKVVGGGSEAFWLRANGGQQWDVDKKMAVPPSPDELEAMKAQAEAYEHQMARIVRTRGVNINRLGSDVADFKNPADVLLTLIAGTTGIPKRILTGSEMGELASSQDRDNWNDQVKDCRSAYGKPVVLHTFIERLVKYGYLPQPTQWDVEWPDIESMSEDEKLDSAVKAKSLNSGGEIVVTGAEIRETYLGREPLPDDIHIVEQWRADLALKMTETNKAQGAIVFTDDEIRKLTYGWKPLSDEEKIPLTAPERVSATAPTPSVDAQGRPIVAAPVGVPRKGIPPAIPDFKAAELAETLAALETAIEHEDLQAIGRILNLQHAYGSTQIQLPDDVAAKLVAFGQSIPDADIAEEAGGRETDAHVTVKYGLLKPDADLLGRIPVQLSGGRPTTISKAQRVSLTLGKSSFFTAADYDVVVIDVKSPGLESLNRGIGTGTPCAPSDHASYVPHATVAYVKSGMGQKYAGWDGLNGVIVVATSIVLVDADGNRTDVSFTQ